MLELTELPHHLKVQAQAWPLQWLGAKRAVNDY